MSTTIRRRVEALESADTANIDFILMLVRGVTPGVQPGAAVRAKMLGQHFEREPAEIEAEFIERLRAYGQAHRRAGQLAVLVLLEGNRHHL